MVESRSQRKKAKNVDEQSFFSCSMLRRRWPNRKYKSFWLNDVMTYICITYSIMRANSCATLSPICNCYRTSLAATFKLATISPKTNHKIKRELSTFTSSIFFLIQFSAQPLMPLRLEFFPLFLGSFSAISNRENSNKNIHGESVCQRFHLCEIDFTGKVFSFKGQKFNK